jgi:hypothetical protein
MNWQAIISVFEVKKLKNIRTSFERREDVGLALQPFPADQCGGRGRDFLWINLRRADANCVAEIRVLRDFV